MNSSQVLYEEYCGVCRENFSKPVWFEDASLNKEPALGGIAGDLNRFSQFYSARAVQESVRFHGQGKLTIILGFSSRISNIDIHVSGGDLVIFIGPYCDISNFSVQSFDAGAWLCFGAGNSVNTGNVLIQGAGRKIFFGHDCMFSTNFHARTSDSHSIFSYETGGRINRDASIRLGDHSWVGRSVIFNKGVWGEDGVIFGQGSVVSGKIEGSSIYAGVPAKSIRKNVTWDRTRVDCLDDICLTYYYRPQRKAVNDFLRDDVPFHPNAKNIYRETREAFVVEKKYPWIKMV